MRLDISEDISAPDGFSDFFVQLSTAGPVNRLL